MLPATCLLAAVQLAGLTASIAEENANTAGEACDVAGEAGGWLTTSKGARAVKGELNKVDQTGCDIERRSFESMDADTFENLYFNKKAVILYHYPERQPAAKGSDKNVLQKDWDAEKVQAWLTQMGLSKVAAEAAAEQVDGFVALEMDATDWKELGASAEDVAKIAAGMLSSDSVWSRDGLRYACGGVTLPVRTVAEAQGGTKASVESTLTEWLDKIRKDEEDGKVHGGLTDPEDDHLGIKAARGRMPDNNLYLSGGELFEACETARSETPGDLQVATLLASLGSIDSRKDFESSPRFSVAGSGAGMGWTQQGDTISLLMTGQQRWWVSPKDETPVQGTNRPDKSMLRWVQHALPMLPKDFMDRSKMQSCTQKAGEVIYLPEGHYHATLGIGETLSLGVVAKSEKWQEIDNERRELARDANKYLAPKHVDKEGNIVDGFDVGPDHADIDSRIQKHLAAHGPNTQLSALQALMHVNAVGIKPMKADAKTVEDAFHVALGCDPLDVETNTEYGKWLVSQKGRFSDQLEQWNRIVAINPPTCDPYIFYGKMMATLEDTKNPPNFALSAQGLRTVSRAMAKGAQRAIIQDPMKNDAMTKNAAEASRGVAEQLANAAMLLASFPLPGESPSAVEKGLFDLAKLWDESNIVPGVTEEDLHADVATKTAAVRKAILEAMHMLKVAKKPLPFAMGDESPGSTDNSAPAAGQVDAAAAAAASADLASGLEVPGADSGNAETKKKKKKKKKAP